MGYWAYIKTKNGKIYYAHHEDIPWNGDRYWKKKEGEIYYILNYTPDQIVKINSEIEPLFDRYIVASKRKCYILTRTEYKKFKHKEGKDIYGAVWDRTSNVPVLKSIVILEDEKWRLI